MLNENEFISIGRVYIYYGSSKNKNKSNIGYIVCENKVIIFDSTYNPLFFNQLVIFLKNKYMKPLELVLSHFHSDHISGVLFSNKYINKIICTKKTYETIQNVSIWKHTCKNNIIICNNEEYIDSMIQIKLIEKCHVIEDIILLDYKEQVVFLGDVFIQKRHPIINFSDITPWIYQLEKIISLNFKYFIPGHGLYSTKETITIFKNYLSFCIEISDKFFSDTVDETRINTYLNNSIYKTWKNRDNFIENIKLLASS